MGATAENHWMIQMLSEDIKSIIHALEPSPGRRADTHPRRREAQAFILNLNSCAQQALGRTPIAKVHRGTPFAKGKSRPTDERVGYERGEAERPYRPMWGLAGGGYGDSAYGRASALSAEAEPDVELAAAKKSYGRRVPDIDKEL